MVKVLPKEAIVNKKSIEYMSIKSSKYKRQFYIILFITLSGCLLMGIIDRLYKTNFRVILFFWLSFSIWPMMDILKKIKEEGNESPKNN